MNLKFLLTSVVIFSFASFVEAQEECAYIAKKTQEYKYPEWEPYQDCAQYVDGRLVIAPEHLTRIGFKSSKPSPFWTSGQFFYVKADGSYLPVIFFDNGADYYREGLTRSRVGGKIAYYNENFEMIIPPRYDWGWPFSDGRALVCLGCSIQDPDKYGHKPIKGGVWGYINKRGEEVVPVKYSQKEVHSK